MLGRGPLPQVTSPEVEKAVQVLLGNGFVRLVDTPEYSWERAASSRSAIRSPPRGRRSWSPVSAGADASSKGRVARAEPFKYRAPA